MRGIQASIEHGPPGASGGQFPVSGSWPDAQVSMFLCKPLTEQGAAEDRLSFMAADRALWASASADVNHQA